MNVSNRKSVRQISMKSLWAAKGRNIIAILAIALTTILFTTLFTIALSINHSFQQGNFRQVGGYSHGGFKYVTEQQIDELKTDPLINEHGLRRFVGMPTEAPFNKAHVEVSYSDANQAKWMFIDPVEGHLPKEGTNEAATDLRVLNLLGVEPKIGQTFTLTFLVDGQETTETFTLSGWWNYDEAIIASHVLVPKSRTQEIFDKLQTEGKDGMTSFWVMDVMLDNGLNIEEKIDTILENHGYQGAERNQEDYIATGVNWGYTGSKALESVESIIGVIGLLLLIAVTGYLIIYNVFQIAVTGDIRFYGLLKTIGMTNRQIKRIIRMQAAVLSLIGIPFGLLIGYFIGVRLTPMILLRMNTSVTDAISASPGIFIVSALFSLATVLISCHRPGRLAAKVSPVEAVRYTDQTGKSKKLRKATKGASLSKMAWANLGRNRRKTIVTILSLSLSVMLLQVTATMVNGFDMDKYLRGVATDFLVADAGYFQVGDATDWNEGMAVAEEDIEEINSREGVTAGGRTYGHVTEAQQFVEEERYRSNYETFYDEDSLDKMVSNSDRLNGLLADRVQLYGMEKFVLDKLTILEGDIAELYTPGNRSIAAVYLVDDHNQPRQDSNWAKLGDTVTVRHTQEWEYYNPDTGEIYENQPADDSDYGKRAKSYQDIDYQVAAVVTIPSTLNYRYYGSEEFVLNAQTFIEDTGSESIMHYAFDTTKAGNPGMESFLKNYTEVDRSQYDYESKATYVENFDSMRSMFLMLGGVLCGIIGIIGVLNYANALLSSILVRRQEFAMLQSIGMTGRQLKQMLIWEGLYYMLGSILFSLILFLAVDPLLSSSLGTLFWFYTYRFTIWPIAAVVPLFTVLGIVLPLISYRYVSKRSIVERLRQTTN
ncbi:ABC transporter permease [Enterococcus sp. 669A]|uniref:ABC transporter permease n=1 Tax=Candidatus Enterococcus moelleringii TaxID=2815325 RepID=A0ABS3LDF5_9ENTE|nr:ABC transporter permease [Enterococcus sp. 669A]MBO1307068.1 ABC transporter permease [Enterococcus sp. 669A]